LPELIVTRDHFVPLGYSPLSPNQLAALSRMPGAVFFDDLVVLARRYLARVHNLHKYDTKAILLAAELANRLEQVNFLAKSIRFLTHEFSRHAFFDEPMPREQHNHIRFMMFLYAASFYYLAFRVETILLGGKKSPTLPEVKGYKRVPAIRLVRNNLLEHQFDDHPDLGGTEQLIHGHFGPAFVLSGASSKGYDKLYKQHKQRAVLVHAKEFRDRAQEILAAAFDRLEVPARPEMFIEDALAEVARSRQKPK
jgi:hypothetical protein